MANEAESPKHGHFTNSHELFKDYFRSRSDIGFLKMLLDLALEPRNPFKPWEPRKAKKGFVVAMLFLLIVCAWFGYFSLTG
jgi:hypothetical protein